VYEDEEGFGSGKGVVGSFVGDVMDLEAISKLEEVVVEA